MDQECGEAVGGVNVPSTVGLKMHGNGQEWSWNGRDTPRPVKLQSLSRC